MQNYKEWNKQDPFTIAPTIQNVHNGDVIKVMENDGDAGRGTIPREYEVMEVYKRTILTKDRKTGFRRCFSYGDLIAMGIECQTSEIETVRKKRTQEGYNQRTEASRKYRRKKRIEKH